MERPAEKEFEDVDFPGRQEVIVRPRAAGLGGQAAILVQQAGANVGFDGHAARGHRANALDEGGGAFVFEEIAARAGQHRALHELGIVIHAQGDHARVGAPVHDLTDRVDAAPAGHVQIHQGDIGPQLLGQPDARLRVAGFADDDQSFLPLQQRSKPITKQRVVIDE